MFLLNLHSGDLSNRKWSQPSVHWLFEYSRYVFIVSIWRCTMSSKAYEAPIFQTHNVLIIEIWCAYNYFSLIFHKPPISEYIHKNVKPQELFIKDLNIRVQQTRHNVSMISWLITRTTVLLNIPLRRYSITGGGQVNDSIQLWEGSL